MAKETAERFASPAEVVEALAPWDQPCPPLVEEELPPFCPAVQRLSNRTSAPGTIQPNCPASSCASLSPGEGILTDPVDAAASALESVAVAPATTPIPAEILAKPARRRRLRPLAWTACTLLVSTLAWVGYRGYVEFFPPALRPVHPPQLKGCDPLGRFRFRCWEYAHRFAPRALARHSGSRSMKAVLSPAMGAVKIEEFVSLIPILETPERLDTRPVHDHKQNA